MISINENRESGHGIYDTIGLPLRSDADLYKFVAEHVPFESLITREDGHWQDAGGAALARLGDAPDSPKLGAGFFIPTGLFNPEHPQPMAYFAGSVQSGELCVNSATGNTFVVAEVRTLDYITIYVTWPAGLARVPKPGEIVTTTAVLIAGTEEF